MIAIDDALKSSRGLIKTAEKLQILGRNLAGVRRDWEFARS